MARFRDLFNLRARHRLSNQSSETSSSSSRSDDESYTPDPYTSDQFCNSFWGKAGYQQILKRSKMSEKMLQDLENFYKERASIESDYAKRLTRLSKSNLFEAIGYEGDGLNLGLEHIRNSTISSAQARADLSKTIKKELQQKVAEFIARREGARKNVRIILKPVTQTQSTSLHLCHISMLIQLNPMFAFPAPSEYRKTSQEIDRIAVTSRKSKLSSFTHFGRAALIPENLQQPQRIWLT